MKHFKLWVLIVGIGLTLSGFFAFAQQKPVLKNTSPAPVNKSALTPSQNKANNLKVSAAKSALLSNLVRGATPIIAHGCHEGYRKVKEAYNQLVASGVQPTCSFTHSIGETGSDTYDCYTDASLWPALFTSPGHNTDLGLCIEEPMDQLPWPSGCFKYDRVGDIVDQMQNELSAAGWGYSSLYNPNHPINEAPTSQNPFGNPNYPGYYGGFREFPEPIPLYYPLGRGTRGETLNVFRAVAGWECARKVVEDIVENRSTYTFCINRNIANFESRCP